MSPQQTEQYRAYLKATGTVAKTRQVVMLYDGVIRFLKQAAVAIQQGKIEERYNLTVRASEVINGLQSSIDFENGGEIAGVLHGFYTVLSRRVISLNFVKDPAECERRCNEIIEEVKQMRDVWDNIDHTLSAGAPSGSAAANTGASGSSSTGAGNSTSFKPPENGVTLSA